ncbi:alpha/beta hydrolase [Aspergillus ustus]|uniref:Alpha/beta hydrolase n=1 Tax=Aspergillus ustus TaxID=40382 RepID=A0A0C1BW79_ASPUT|nr:alpha/beta hydrolase [Aspergillus ustus]
MAVPGILIRLSDKPAVHALATPSIETTYTLSAGDSETPSHAIIYFLSDISSLINSNSLYESDKASSESSTPPSWIICKFINGRDTTNPSGAPKTNPHTLATPPPLGSTIVMNGSTPRPDKESDYHAWYDEEHGGKLALVPGWRGMRRYALAKVYGEEVETATFYGVNFYDEVNGLGGPEWKAGVTEWTHRIRQNAAKGNLRRVWRVEQVREE